MKIKKLTPIFALPFVLVLLLVVTPSYSASSSIPAWIKGVANYWVEGNISDDEFGEAITFLIEQGILKVEMPQTADSSALNKKITELEAENKKLKNEISQLKEQNAVLQNKQSLQKPETQNTKAPTGFSGLVCKKGYGGYVELHGKYTNGPESYSFITISFAIIGNNEEVLDRGSAIISNIGPHETKSFTAFSTYSGDFKRCDVQIDLGY